LIYCDNCKQRQTESAASYTSRLIVMRKLLRAGRGGEGGACKWSCNIS